MKANGVTSNGNGGPLSRLMALERLIKERENEIINDPLAGDDLSDEEGLLDEDGVEPRTDVEDTKTEADKPHGDPVDDGFVTDSSDDNESVISEESDSGDLNNSSMEEANALKSKGDDLVRTGNYAEAIKCYSEALKYSKLSTIYGNRSLCYMKTEQFDEAERDCSDAIKLDPNYKRIFRRRAAIRLRRRDYYGSARDLQDLKIISASSAVDPTIQEEYKTILPLARYVALNGNRSDDPKFKELETAVLAKLCEKEIADAKAFKSRNMWAQVVESLSMAIVVSPYLPHLYSERALANFKLDKLNLAEKDCTEAIDLDPSNPEYFRWRAEIRKKLGNLSGSEADERAAKELPPARTTKEPTPTRPAVSPLRPAEPEPRPKIIELRSESTEKPKSAVGSHPKSAIGSQPKSAIGSQPKPAESSILVRVPVQDVYASSIDEPYDLSKLPDKIKSLFGLS